MLSRRLQNELTWVLQNFPSACLLGPRQAGKTTLARQIAEDLGKDYVLFDCEFGVDAKIVADAEVTFPEHQDRLVVIDEVQRVPEVFPILRALIDQHRVSGRFLLLGSVSPEITLKAGESLTGRILYRELTPFNIAELPSTISLKKHWFRGGLPPSILAKSNLIQQNWIEGYIRSFIERDIPAIAGAISVIALRQLWTMIANAQGNILNSSSFAQALGVSVPTINKYLDVLEHSFMISRLPAFALNVNKRLVRAPKIYIRDSGLLHSLANIHSHDALDRNVLIGASWEGYVIEQIRQGITDTTEMSYFRTQDGAEVDLVLSRGGRVIATVEVKYSSMPVISKGVRNSVEYLQSPKNFIVVPQGIAYNQRDNFRVVSLLEFLENELPSLLTRQGGHNVRKAKRIGKEINPRSMRLQAKPYGRVSERSFSYSVSKRKSKTTTRTKPKDGFSEETPVYMTKSTKNRTVKSTPKQKANKK